MRSDNPALEGDGSLISTSRYMSETPTLFRGVHLATTIIFVDGLTRTGKSMLGPILASFERIEIERVEEIIEYVGALHRMGKISRDAAVSLLQMEVDMHLHNSMISRNTNFRFGDHSGVWRSPNRLRYLRRLFAPGGDSVVGQIAGEKPIYQNQTHDQLQNLEIHHEAFGDRLRIVEMIRHPVDLVDSWLRRGWGSRFGNDPRALTFCVRYRDQDLPYYALGWEELYLSSSPLGRVVRMVARLWDEGQAVYSSLPAEQRTHQVFMISFEDFVQRPTAYLGRIADFLGTGTTRHTSSALKRQNCPRPYSVEARHQKQGRIESEASPEEREILNRLIEEYEAVAGAVAIQNG